MSHYYRISSPVFIRLQGRVCVVGAISQYNAVAPVKVADLTIDFIIKEIKMQGMMVSLHFERFQTPRLC